MLHLSWRGSVTQQQATNDTTRIRFIGSTSKLIETGISLGQKIVIISLFLILQVKSIYPAFLFFTMAQSILLINGPNLNLLGTREPHLYGAETLADVESRLETHCASLSTTSKQVSISCFQSNHEGFLIDRIHQARADKVDAIIINAGAFTHTSVALRDALSGVNIPFVEIHVTNVHAREEFRHRSFLADKAIAVICGLGTYGYVAALEFCISHLKI